MRPAQLEQIPSSSHNLLIVASERDLLPLEDRCLKIERDKCLNHRSGHHPSTESWARNEAISTAAGSFESSQRLRGGWEKEGILMTMMEWVWQSREWMIKYHRHFVTQSTYNLTWNNNKDKIVLPRLSYANFNKSKLKNYFLVEAYYCLCCTYSRCSF